MTLPRITALATVLIHLVASVAMGLVYLCQMSGEVGLAACCCQQARSQTQRPDGQASPDAPDAPDSPDSPDSHDAAHAPGCCEVSQIEASLVPSLPEKRAPEPVPATAWPWLVPDPALRLAAHHESVLAPARVALSPPRGAPLYLRIRSLLL